MEAYKNLYLTQLNQLKEEIKSYRHTENIWKNPGGINNNSGNLCLHICGNLNYFIGAVIGKSGYVRDRDSEFSEMNLPSEKLLEKIDETIDMTGKLFDNADSNILNSVYPLDKFGKNVTNGFVLARLVSHLSYHLGQINYHRRIVEGQQ